ncbi:tRNA (N6-threonylcarbamoyladenosine(37)-N6)-methyltransferase TrmO [Kosmotoga pacifica]|uniref:tRNA (N6-threonylcarbamoyladenosine(37)-N6)-methyltransferase TrmO n=1 Tax=Kosmotoga pacifica TaxID=1330330 RepID=UPI000AF5AE10|nr:tRNA (N6-threonylcarbamoyladenosine(37)-N6)-methyltransferase TrmO [Kosmotoga pacifica]
MDIIYKPIGKIHSPYARKEETPRQGILAGDIEFRIEIFSEFSEGLNGIERYEYLIVLSHFHKSVFRGLKIFPHGSSEKRGVFATRSPNHPNPIAFNVVKLIKREGNILVVKELDAIDGTPVLDIKPFIPSLDAKF